VAATDFRVEVQMIPILRTMKEKNDSRLKWILFVETFDFDHEAIQLFVGFLAKSFTLKLL